MDESGKEHLRGALLNIWVGFIAFVVIMGLFFFKAVEQEEFMSKSMFYFGFGALFLIAVTVGISTISAMVKKGTLSEEKYGWANLFIHDPEEDSVLYNTALGKYLTLGNIIHFGIIFSLAISIYSTITNTFFIALPSTEFQVTETGKLILGTEPAALMETISMIYFLGLAKGFSRMFVARYNLSKAIENLLYFLLPFATAIVWIAMHYARYGAQETNLIAVGAFGFIGGMLSIMTGSIIPWYLWHIANNLFGKAKELFSNETVLPIIIILLVVYVSIVVIFKLLKRRK